MRTKNSRCQARETADKENNIKSERVLKVL